MQLPQPGFSFPMGTTVLPPEAVGAVMGRDVSALLAPDAVVMGATTAGLRGAQAGDVLQLVASGGGVVLFRIAAVLPDARVGGTELLMSPQAADRLGISDLSRALLWNPSSQAAMDAALAANGLVSTSIRIRRSWDPPDPDDTIGMAQTKALLGEFTYRVNANGSVSQNDAWVAASLPGGRVLLNGSIPISARCHNVIEPALRAALAEVAAAGLGATINVGDANSYGGCHLARFNRLTPDSSLGFLSAALLGHGTRHQHAGFVPGVRSPRLRNPAGRVHHGADLPQVRIRLGRELPDPGRHALRVRRRAP